MELEIWEDLEDPIDQFDKVTWENYLDIELKYRWFVFNSTFYEDANEDIPVHPCGDFTEEGFVEPDPLSKEGTKAFFNNNMMCMDDNDKYKLFGGLYADRMGSIQLEVAACDPSARADTSTCETDEAKLREYMDRNIIRVQLLTNLKEYDTHSY